MSREWCPASAATRCESQVSKGTPNPALQLTPPSKPGGAASRTAPDAEPGAAADRRLTGDSQRARGHVSWLAARRLLSFLFGLGGQFVVSGCEDDAVCVKCQTPRAFPTATHCTQCRTIASVAFRVYIPPRVVKQDGRPCRKCGVARVDRQDSHCRNCGTVAGVAYQPPPKQFGLRRLRSESRSGMLPAEPPAVAPATDGPAPLTKRPLNQCRGCRSRWFPRGSDRSVSCPRCSSSDVESLSPDA